MDCAHDNGFDQLNSMHSHMVEFAQSVVLNKCVGFCQFVTITRNLLRFIVYVRGRSTSNLLQTCWGHLSGDGRHQKGLDFDLNFSELFFIFYLFIIFTTITNISRMCMCNAVIKTG